MTSQTSTPTPSDTIPALHLPGESVISKKWLEKYKTVDLIWDDEESLLAAYIAERGSDLSLGCDIDYGHKWVNQGGTPVCKKCGLVYSPKWYAKDSKVGCYPSR